MEGSMISTVFATAAIVAILQQAPAPQAAAQPDSALLAPAATTPPAPAEAEDPRLDERVCRTEIVVGTRFNSRTCMTRREWNERRDASRNLAHRVESRNSRRDSPPLATTTGR
jgi:hypothetical protein